MTVSHRRNMLNQVRCFLCCRSRLRRCGRLRILRMVWACEERTYSWNSFWLSGSRQSNCNIMKSTSSLTARGADLFCTATHVLVIPVIWVQTSLWSFQFLSSYGRSDRLLSAIHLLQPRHRTRPDLTALIHLSVSRDVRLLVTLIFGHGKTDSK